MLDLTSITLNKNSVPGKLVVLVHMHPSTSIGTSNGKSSQACTKIGFSCAFSLIRVVRTVSHCMTGNNVGCDHLQEIRVL